MMWASERFGFVVASILAIAATGPQTLADTVLKKDGGKIVGTVLEEESDDNNLTVQTRFGKQRVARNAIKEVRYGGDSVQDYQQAVKNYADTAADQFKLALWCLENKYRKEYAKHLNRTIELDPAHPEARRRLGFSLYDGQWMTADEIKEAQGFIKHNGKWILPQEKDLQESTGEKQKSRQDIYKRIRIWRAWLKSEKSDRQTAGLEGLRELKDAAAVKPLFDLFTDKKSTDAERRVLVDLLGAIPGGESASCLVKLALNDNVAENRQVAAMKLKERKSPEMLAEILRYLKDNDNKKVNRAAAILGEIGDNSVYVPLAEALITKHKHTHEPSVRELAEQQWGSQRLGGYQVNPDGTISGPSVVTQLRAQNKLKEQRQGGYAWNQPKTQVVVEELKNEGVLNALMQLTGQNFGYEKKSWLKWVKDDEKARSSKIKT